MLYVPLLIVTHVADPRLAAVLAQPIIVGAAMAGAVLIHEKHLHSVDWFISLRVLFYVLIEGLSQLGQLAISDCKWVSLTGGQTHWFIARS